ncbi:hypothetical protein GCM10010221_00550 [Streptomyces parvus]|nr:hypothetical protein GCM10010221_00550 [Streptomyces parvus]
MTSRAWAGERRRGTTEASETTSASLRAHTLSGLAQSLHRGVTGERSNGASGEPARGPGLSRDVAAWCARCRLVSRDRGLSSRE